MLILLSPAKTLDFESDSKIAATDKPRLIRQSQALAKQLKRLSPNDLRDLMSISQELAELNHQRFQDWDGTHSKPDSKAALFAFQGDVYRGLKADELTTKQIQYAQSHLRVLSGLYGVLKPLDRMQPYRLEMGTRLQNERGKDLYDFWGDRIATTLNKDLDESKSKRILNLASNEYFKSVDKSVLNAEVISPTFKEYKNGKYKLISFFAKVARGTMASWVVRNRAKTVKKLTQFNEDGYRYDAESSTDTVPVFLRGGG